MRPVGGDHGVLAFEIGRRLANFVDSRQLGWVLGGETGIYTRRKPDRVRGMDVAFLSKQRQPQRPLGFLATAPELIIEIISPTDRWSAMRQKIDEYFDIGVERVWIVEPGDQTVLVYRAATILTKLTTDDTVHGEGLLAGFSIPLAELFAG